MTQPYAQLLEGKPLALQMQAELKAQIEALQKRGISLKMVTLEVGADASSKVYVKRQGDACRKVGIVHEVLSLPTETTQAQLETQIEALNRDPAVSGLILQLPLPAHLASSAAQEHIEPSKDVEGVHPENLGRLLSGIPACAPATALSAFHLIKAGVGGPLRGKQAVVVGRSQIVGRPLALMLLSESCTVTVCHTGTKDLKAECLRAEILAVAVGKAGLVTGEMVRPGAVVVDVGTNSVEVAGKWTLTGDVDFASAKLRAGRITPVPGGVGPLTVMMLLRNLVLSAEKRAG
ncbi:MAG TPA: bifunctional 5,10-methylenetetrahydrofolate dehydrogenase/5,10-methenyltetrahydrofolate cyclohydrolase [Planctomycetota bacterium]|nr:bifunctional 5,10-methylenetetrahydrofolate dehydrogenase/5,10-methenyltetrahydrofolate cyclohydrolase [Planctomycetota bacterium]